MNTILVGKIVIIKEIFTLINAVALAFHSLLGANSTTTLSP